MKYDTLVFDLDGTLTNPAVGIVRCVNYALTTFDYDARPEHEITPYIGPPLEITLQELSGESDQATVQKLVDAYRERYGEFGIQENTVYPGIHELLGELRSRKIPMGICTSKLEINAIKILKEFNLFEYFDFVSGSSGKKFLERKSEQLAALIETNTITTKALMIGDRNVDIEAANENNLDGCGVLWGYGDTQELEKEAPVFIVEQPGDLLHALEI